MGEDQCDTNAGVYYVVTYYPDTDNDGHCSSGTPITACRSTPTAPAGFRLSCPGGTRDDCDSNPSGYINVTVFRDWDGDQRCASATPSVFCTDGSAPAGYRSSCPFGTSDCNDSRADLHTNMTCYADFDNDGACTSSAVQCTNGVSCEMGYRPSCTAYSDCNDGNPFANANCSFVTQTPRRDHCCCACCPCNQPATWSNIETVCGAGFHIETCTPERIGGTGSLEASILDGQHCALTQYCGGGIGGPCDGSSARLSVLCVSN